MRNSVLCYLEETATQLPDRVAMTDSREEITFGQWRERALCLADAIRAKVKERQIPILIYLPKSAMALVSFAGVLYSGGYYTPTDVRFPFEKVNSIMQCLSPRLIITDRKNGEKLLKNGVPEEKMIFLEDIDFSERTKDAGEYLREAIDTDLAYVLFTSGSTGVPKGVSITHRGIIDYIDWAGEEFEITAEERIANQAPFYFDNSVLDIYLCMSRGAHLFVMPESYFAMTESLLKYLRENKINFIFWVPSALIAVANSGLLEQMKGSSIRKVLFAGEIMPSRHLNCWRRVLPEAVYANLYGPTEITDVCTFYRLDRAFRDDEPLPIGEPCRNMQVLLLDGKNRRICEPDVLGEIYVRGTGISVGYYNNPDKTAEAFVQNPLNPHYEEKIYRTGDLAHYNERGELMFDGRKDFQIKHKGYRIELGEIETAILGQSEIENACCIYDEKDSVIVAFCEGKDMVSEREIRRRLMKILPQYMMPGRYILLSEFPHNDNGKIDRKYLKQQYLGGTDK